MSVSIKYFDVAVATALYTDIVQFLEIYIVTQFLAIYFKKYLEKQQNIAIIAIIISYFWHTEWDAEEMTSLKNKLLLVSRACADGNQNDLSPQPICQCIKIAWEKCNFMCPVTLVLIPHKQIQMRAKLFFMMRYNTENHVLNAGQNNHNQKTDKRLLGFLHDAHN